MSTEPGCLCVTQERELGRAIGVPSRPVVMSESPANHVLVDWDVERQCDLLGDSGQLSGRKTGNSEVVPGLSRNRTRVRLRRLPGAIQSASNFWQNFRLQELVKRS